MSCGCVGQNLTQHCGFESRSHGCTVLSAGIRPTAVVTVEFSQFVASSGACPITAQCQRQRGKTTAEKTDQGVSGQLFQAADTNRTSRETDHSLAFFFPKHFPNQKTSGLKESLN